MPIVTWTPELSVGVDPLDADHQRLLATINDVFDALLGGNSSLATQKALKELDTYIAEHFSREEAWLYENSFSEYEAHRKEHAALCAQIRHLQQLNELYEQQLAVELLVVLRDWLVGHIAHSDRGAIRRGR